MEQQNLSENSSSVPEDQVEEGQQIQQNEEAENVENPLQPQPTNDYHYNKLKELLASGPFMSGVTFKQIKRRLLFNKDYKCYTILCDVFKTIENVNEFLQICKNTQKGLCSGPIIENQQTYICQDCGRETEYHIYCSKCFELSLMEGKHAGHRFKAQTGRSGCCDCGDVDSIEKNGFCSMHCGEVKCDKKMNPQIQQRFQEMIINLFEVLFYYCEEHTSHLRLFSTQAFEDESMLEMDSLDMFISNIVNALSFLIVEYSKDKLPLQFFISELLFKPYNRKLRHSCKSNVFEETLAERTEHICQDSIVKLLFKYSISLNKVEKQITDMFYSLSVNPLFKSKLASTFLECLDYILVMYTSHQNLPVVTIFHIYFLYCQFFTGSKTDHFLNCPQFDKLKQKVKFMINLINTKYYGEYNNTMTLVGIYERLGEVVKTQKRESIAFRLMEDFMNFAPLTSQERGRKFDHHRFKTLLMNHFLDRFADYTSIIKYKEPESKKRMERMVRKYFKGLIGIEQQIEEKIKQNPQILQKEKQNDSDWESYESDEQKPEVVVPEPAKVIKIQLKEQDPRGEIRFGWYCLPELNIGNLISNIYNYQGKQALSEYLEPMKQEGSYQIYLKKLVSALTSAYTIGQSKEVGFPQQYPPKDLYKYFYKFPTRYPYDCIVSVLQILAVVSPNEFIEAIENLEPGLLVELLSDIFMEQSAFVNMSNILQFDNKLAKNSLKIQLINILNLRHKTTFADMKKNFLQQMFRNQVDFNQIISEVAVLDSKTELYTAKQNYKNLEETILIKRAQNSFANFFEGEQSTLNLVQKGNLFKKQISEGWTTLCVLATKSLAETGRLGNLLDIVLKEAWNASESSKNYNTIELIYVILLRNINNQQLRAVGKRILLAKPETNTQKLVHEILSKLDKEEVEVTEKKPKQSPVKSNNKMKIHLEKLKKQQQKFIQNNPNLFKQIQEDHENEAANQQNVCLICQQGKIQKQYPVFLVSSQFQMIEQLKITTYMSCGHIFHLKCLATYAAGLCPVCKHLYENTFPLIPQKQITMLNPDTQNTVSCSLDETLFRFSKGDPIALRIVEMTFAKVYFATLQSCSKFINKDLKQLRSVYSNYIIRKQKRQNFLTQEVLFEMLYSRTESLFNHKQDNTVLFNLLYRLLLVPFYCGSLKTKQTFNDVVSIQYTFLYADYFFSFVEAENKDYLAQVKIHEEALNGKMTEFCKAIAFTYAVMFDDPRNQIISTIQDETKAGQILTQQYPEFFFLHTQKFVEYVQKYINDKQYKESIPEVIIPIPYTIPVLENYMEFHKSYYDLICDECQGVTQFYNNELWLCLLCGYRSCLVNCPKLNSQQGYLAGEAVYAHFDNEHFSSGIAIELNSGLIGIVQSSALFEYGYLYENAFGQHNSKKIKNWKELTIQTNRWSKLLDLLKKRAMRIYVVQQNLKGRIFQDPNEQNE